MLIAVYQEAVKCRKHIVKHAIYLYSQFLIFIGKKRRRKFRHFYYTWKMFFWDKKREHFVYLPLIWKLAHNSSLINNFQDLAAWIMHKTRRSSSSSMSTKTKSKQIFKFQVQCNDVSNLFIRHYHKDHLSFSLSLSYVCAQNQCSLRWKEIKF